MSVSGNSTTKPWTVQWVMDLLLIKDCTGHVTLSIDKFGFGAVLGTGMNRGKECVSACTVKVLQSGWSVFLTEAVWLSLNFLPGHLWAQLKSFRLPVDNPPPSLPDEMQVNSLLLRRSAELPGLLAHYEIFMAVSSCPIQGIVWPTWRAQTTSVSSQGVFHEGGPINSWEPQANL